LTSAPEGPNGEQYEVPRLDRPPGPGGEHQAGGRPGRVHVSPVGGLLLGLELERLVDDIQK
jgi:hypothetical protein